MAGIITAPRVETRARATRTGSVQTLAQGFNLLTFNNEVTDTHAQYNPSTGVFTCLFPGLWLFTSHWYLNTAGTITTPSAYSYVQVDGATNVFTQEVLFTSGSFSLGAIAVSAQVVVELAANQTVRPGVLISMTGATMLEMSLSATYPVYGFTAARLQP
jgi:hypothetical protein